MAVTYVLPVIALCPTIAVYNPPRGGGGRLGSNYAWIWVLFQLQGSEMSEKSSLKMGVKSAAALNMGENLC